MNLYFEPLALSSANRTTFSGVGSMYKGLYLESIHNLWEMKWVQSRYFFFISDMDVHYQLPMDRIVGSSVENPSGLDARVTGIPRLVLGAAGNAIQLDCAKEKVMVSGPGHRDECFGDLSLCPNGKTL